jgi:hypothetical protein
MARRKFRGPWYTAAGDVVRSGLEARVIDDLEQRGIKYEYETTSYEWFDKSPGVCEACDTKGATYVSRWYTPDIWLPMERYWVEVKGKFTARDRKIALGVQYSHPDVEIRFLFQKDNWLTPVRAQRYSEWAIKNGFKCAIGERIPDEWIS